MENQDKPEIVRRIWTLAWMEVQILYASEEEWEEKKEIVNKFLQKVNPVNNNHWLTD